MRTFLLFACSVLALTTAAWAQPSPVAPKDSLKVVFCGTSGPLPVRDRAKPCTAIVAGGKLYLVDIGPEATENLMAWRLPVASARAVFITHLHSDHIGGLGEFNMQSWVAGREQPLPVIGPPGVESLTLGFNKAYEQDHLFRHAHHEHGDVKLPINAGIMVPKVVKLPASSGDAPRISTAWSEGDLKVTAIAVQHSPADPAYAYRFDYKGRSVVVSGDTRKWPPLAAAAKGADVLIHEAQNNDMTRMLSAGLAAQGSARMSSIMTDTLSYHTTPVEAAEIAKAGGVRILVLNHLTQAGLPFFRPDAFMKGVEAVGGPEVKLSLDGMTIDLPEGSSEIMFGQF